MHTLYFNAVVLLAGAASAVVGIRRRDWKPVLAVGGIGIVSAASLIPYADPLSRENLWIMVIKYQITPAGIMGKVIESIDTSAFGIWSWSAMTIVVVGR